MDGRKKLFDGEEQNLPFPHPDTVRRHLPSPFVANEGVPPGMHAVLLSLCDKLKCFSLNMEEVDSSFLPHVFFFLSD
jgi:hypothetical protein